MSGKRTRPDPNAPKDGVEQRIIEAEDQWWRTFVTHGMETAGTPPWNRPLSDFAHSPVTKLLMKNPATFDNDPHYYWHECEHETLRRRGRHQRVSVSSSCGHDLPTNAMSQKFKAE